jgi:hypothetical protein
MPSEEHNGKLSDALEQWVNSLPMEGDGDIGLLGEWIAVVTMVSVDEDGEPRAEYYLAMRNGTMLPHTALGLLHRGLYEIKKAERGEED